MALTTKDDEDNKLLEETIRANGKIMEKITTRLPIKRRPKLIIYNVAKNTTEEEVKDALENQDDYQTEIRFFSRWRERTESTGLWKHTQKHSSI